MKKTGIRLRSRHSRIGICRSFKSRRRR